MLTPEQEALVDLGNHSVRCLTCKPEWHGDTPIHQRCPDADALYEQYRQARRAEART